MNVLVTGSGDVGSALVRALLDAGHPVVAVSRNAIRDLAGLPGIDGAAVHDCDLTDDRDAGRVAETVRRAHPEGIDAIVLTAGGFVLSKDSPAAPVDDWRRMIAINLETAVVATRQFVPLLADGGRVVYFGAAAALDAGERPANAPYLAAKRGLHTLARATAHALGDRNGRANVIAPETIRTPANEAAMGDAPMVSMDRLIGAVLGLIDPGCQQNGDILRLAGQQ